jgi:hypothetical protein
MDNNISLELQEIKELLLINKTKMEQQQKLLDMIYVVMCGFSVREKRAQEALKRYYDNVKEPKTPSSIESESEYSTTDDEIQKVD